MILQERDWSSRSCFNPDTPAIIIVDVDIDPKFGSDNSCNGAIKNA